MLRIRFHTTSEDYRPVTWPVHHPYWKTGEDGLGRHSIIVTYADNEDYVYRYWPEASDLDIEEVEGYEFTGRFPRPEWFTG